MHTDSTVKLQNKLKKIINYVVMAIFGMEYTDFY